MCFFEFSGKDQGRTKGRTREGPGKDQGRTREGPPYALDICFERVHKDCETREAPQKDQGPRTWSPTCLSFSNFLSFSTISIPLLPSPLLSCLPLYRPDRLPVSFTTSPPTTWLQRLLSLLIVCLVSFTTSPPTPLFQRLPCNIEFLERSPGVWVYTDCAFTYWAKDIIANARTFRAKDMLNMPSTLFEGKWYNSIRKE